jgi:predicted nucleotidyltransferase
MPNQIEKNLAAICNQYDIADLYVFGSRDKEIAGLVTGDATLNSNTESDVDMAILPATRETWSPEKRVKLTMALEDLFQVGRVDLVLLPEADPYLALDVIRGELLYSQDLDQQARYELFVLRRAADLLPFKKERIRMIMEEGA